jgi:hypothetical protein
MSKDSDQYEEVARILLNRMHKEFGLERVEGKQDIEGLRSGTSWKIDAKGIREGDGAIIIVECRRYTSSQLKQEHLGGLAYRILDTGAVGGITVSPMALQEGASKVAAAENIAHIQLSPESTPEQFVLQFLNKIFVGIAIKSGASVRAEPSIMRQCESCRKPFEVVGSETLCRDCALPVPSSLEQPLLTPDRITDLR